MQLVIKNKTSFPYCSPLSETYQPNPVRWRLCYREGNILTPQSAWWKCKDYMNDVVWYYRKQQTFKIYGMSNNQNLNEDGSYLALAHIKIVSFTENLKLINTYLNNKHFPELEVFTDIKTTDVTNIVVKIPLFYWENTFFISFILCLLRACCFSKQDTLQDLVKQEVHLSSNIFNQVDKIFTLKNVSRFNELIFINYDRNGVLENINVTNYNDMSSIHNAGINSWLASDHGIN